MIFRFILMSLQTLEFLLDEETSEVNTSENLIVENYKHSNFFRFSKYLNNMVSNQYNFSNEEDRNIQIKIPINLQVVEFIKDFIEIMLDSSIFYRSEEFYLKLFDDFIQKFIPPELRNEKEELKRKTERIIYYIYSAFDYLNFDSRIQIKFLRIIFLFLKKNEIFDVELFALILRDPSTILNNFSFIFTGSIVDFKYCGDYAYEIYDSIVTLYTKNEIIRNSIITIPLQISEKLRKIKENMNILTYFETLKINDINFFYDFLNFLQNNSYQNIRNLELDFSHDDVISDTIEYPRIYEILPNLQSFSYAGSLSNFRTGIKFFEMLPKLIKIHLKIIIYRNESDILTVKNNLIKFINEKEIEIYDLIISENLKYFFNCLLIEFSNNRYIKILYLTDNDINFNKWLNYISREDKFPNLKCLMIRSDIEIKDDFINKIRNKVNSLLQVKHVNYHKTLYFRALNDRYELEHLELYQDEADINDIVLENVNLEHEYEINLVNNLSIKYLKVINSVVSTRFFENFHKSKLRENLENLTFENVIIMTDKNYKNNNILNFEVFVLKNMDIPGEFIDCVLKNLNVSRLILNNIEFDLDNFLKLRPMLLNAEYLEIYDTNLDIEYLNIIYETNDIRKSFKKRTLIYRPRKKITVKNFNDFDNLQGFKIITIENYDEEFQKIIEKRNFKNSKNTSFYFIEENNISTNPFLS